MNLKATACIQSLHFYIKTSCLLGDNHKFFANVMDKDHKITKIHRFLACYLHLNVMSNIRMFQHLNVPTF